jgi:hypothetical protein
MQRDHPEARLGVEPLEDVAARVQQFDLDERLLDARGRCEGLDRPEQPLDERLVRAFGNGRPDTAQNSFVSAGAAPMCARPSFVIVRPRGVRWMKPSWSMNGS